MLNKLNNKIQYTIESKILCKCYKHQFQRSDIVFTQREYYFNLNFFLINFKCIIFIIYSTLFLNGNPPN